MAGAHWLRINPFAEEDENLSSEGKLVLKAIDLILTTRRMPEEGELSFGGFDLYWEIRSIAAAYYDHLDVVHLGLDNLGREGYIDIEMRNDRLITNIAPTDKLSRRYIDGSSRANLASVGNSFWIVSR